LDGPLIESLRDAVEVLISIAYELAIVQIPRHNRGSS
jgi:hypothetical protein